MKLYRDEDKNEQIKKRAGAGGIGFEDIESAIMEGKILAIIPNLKAQYTDQEIMIVEVQGYVREIPSRRTAQGTKLITAYPSRKRTAFY